MKKMKELKCRKRSGEVVDFNLSKITKAMGKAFIACNVPVTQELLELLTLRTVAHLTPVVHDNVVEIEQIQDSVENTLSESGFVQVAKSYMNYRNEHFKARNMENTMLDYKDIVNNYLGDLDWRVKENSTVTKSLGGLILSNSGAITANYWLTEVYDPEIANAHRNAQIHIHDLSMLSGYCAGWSLRQLIEEGLGGVPDRITSSPARHLTTLCNQMVNFLGIMQNEWAGAQAFSSFDTYLAPFVKVDNLSYKQVKQAIQSFVFGVNTPSRWGCVDTNTEVLSIDGWKKYNELKEGDLIYTWKDGKLQINKVRKVIIKPFKGKMHSYKKGFYNQMVTPNHRMLVKKFNKEEYEIKKSEEIFNVKTSYPLPTMFSSSELKGLKLTDTEIQLAAILYTDGSIELRNDKIHKVKIFKSKNRFGIELIETLLTDYNIQYSKKDVEGGFDSEVCQFSIYGDSAKKLANLIDKNKKEISKKFMNMNYSQANLFIETWAKFDGDFHKLKLQYDNETIGDQLQQICLLAGYTTYHSTRSNTNYIKCRKFKNIIPSEKIEVDYDGYVWCPNVENGTAVFRKDGNVYISGQTQAPFTNVTLDWTVPADLKDRPAIVGGKEMDFTYGDCKKEMDMVNKAFLEIMIEGDANGRGFQYPMNVSWL